MDALNERQVCVVRVDPASVGVGLMFGAYLIDGQAEWTGRLQTPSRDVALGEIGAVYFRRPNPYLARFSHLPQQARDFAATEARYGLGGVLNSLLKATYVNHPISVTRADYKPAQLQMAVQHGLSVPATLITNDPERARKFAAKHGPVIYKSFRGAPRPADGNTAAIWTQRIKEEDLDESVTVTAHMFQREVNKTADARVTVVGRSVFASRITTPDGALDWRRGNWDELIHEPIAVPDAVARALHAYLDGFGLAFGCFDFALEPDPNDHTAGAWTFIECNPNGQWGWLPDSDAIAHAFADVLTEGWR
ncbi:ATP-grasp ribosomal peptide maturase [Nonomuraea cavernae]|uniref:ATP-grasp ribosomal peptide maturase n=1 Tax=Nonomuraea cavernae TaxID=2045107 RepID=UPI00227CB52B|nr:ATP-grasp ribosomal peptide maturase [Nonomuraea cavernae]